jgi:hypothetical protein
MQDVLHSTGGQVTVTAPKMIMGGGEGLKLRPYKFRLHCEYKLQQSFREVSPQLRSS